MAGEGRRCDFPQNLPEGGPLTVWVPVALATPEDGPLCYVVSDATAAPVWGAARAEGEGRTVQQELRGVPRGERVLRTWIPSAEPSPRAEAMLPFGPAATPHLVVQVEDGETRDLRASADAPRSHGSGGSS